MKSGKTNPLIDVLQRRIHSFFVCIIPPKRPRAAVIGALAPDGHRNPIEFPTTHPRSLSGPAILDSS
jgi:hypothetical protein